MTKPQPEEVQTDDQAQTAPTPARQESVRPPRPDGVTTDTDTVRPGTEGLTTDTD